MKHFSKMLLGMAAFGLVACSSEEPINNVPAEGDVFASLTVQLPSAGGTRSETTDWTQDDFSNSDAGYEYGQGYENNVNSVFVVLVKKEGDKLTYLKSSLSSTEASNTAGDPTYTLAFKADELISLAGEKVSVITFCNPTAELVATVQALTPGVDFNTDLTYTLKSSINEIASPNNFLMASRSLNNEDSGETSIDIPAEDELLNTYNSPKNAFKLGTYKVDRVVSRFDYMQTKDDSKYEIKDNKDVTVGYVVLDGMALINQAKEFYYLPRVSDNGMNADATLFGREVKTNYVVSPHDVDKTTKKASELFGNYFFPICDASGNSLHASTFNYTSISSIINGTKDDHNVWNPSENTDYRIWCYTTENTIPVVERQQRGITTGVVFKGHIEIPASLNESLHNAMQAGEIIYTYNDILYGTKADLQAVAKGAPVSAFTESFKAAFGDNACDVKAEDLTDLQVDGENGDFVAYKPVKVGDQYVYNVYYFYYNRHNDNKNPNQMAPMEFATVRNNVYKLSVTNITKFGRPTDKPDIPDEDPKSYFQVSCKVMPWVVRLNEIEL